jgi:uncharacterized protein
MIFVDTGAWVTQFSRRDQYHKRGAQFFTRLHDERTQLATSTPVLYETVTFLTRQVGAATAIRAGRQISGWKSLRLLRPEASDEIKALAIMEKFSDHPIGFVDCLSFALMHRSRISTAFTFDRHFELAGFLLFT